MSENLINLVKIIRDRKNEDGNKSYTSSLLSGGLSKCIDKMEEEFGEFKEALNKKSNVVHEAAASIFHYGKHSIQEAKQYLDSKGIPVRI